ncbi:Dps family protein [Deinococcus alpinitundrae]|uniref:Dps family protein n=1 Tax=Deinococcus alpinitundrae TaxID=468913 RepID=UPI00137A38CE|nr:Dps family protein [Deinococcus alpinitundrae]
MKKTTLMILSTFLIGSALAGGAGAQSTKLPVNQFSTLPKSGTDDLAKSARALQSTLTELQALQLQTKQAHWNVSGTLFYPIHLMLQEHYEGIATYADEVAERLLAVGSSSDGRAPTIVQTSGLPEIPGGFIDDARVLTFFTTQYQTVGERLKKRIDDVEKVDPTSANLLQEVEHGIEKYQWQVRAEFQQTPTDPNTGFDINGGKPVSLPGK